MIDCFAETQKHSVCVCLLLVEGSDEGVYIALKIGVSCADGLSKLLCGFILHAFRAFCRNSPHASPHQIQEI